MSLWLAIDVSYLAWRAYHSTGSLDNGVAFGFLREVRSLCNRFVPAKTVFAFDVGRSKRAKLYPDYKRKGIRTEQQQLASLQVMTAIDSLHLHYLPELGFTNLFYQEGYEADDIIASVVQNKPGGTDVVIVSADKDLYQLLHSEDGGNDISIWHPQTKKFVTEISFIKEYGVSPRSWPTVKAIAGCTSDNIKGVKGVGEKTAIKFLNGSLGWNRYEAIHDNHDEILERLKLVKLPFEGTNPCIPNGKDKATDRKWDNLFDRLGFKSLLEKAK